MLSFLTLWSRWHNFLFHWQRICLVTSSWGGGLVPLQRRDSPACLEWALTVTTDTGAAQPPFYPPTIHLPGCEPQHKPRLFPLLQNRTISKHRWCLGAWLRKAGTSSAPAHSQKCQVQEALTKPQYKCPSWGDGRYVCVYLFFYTLWFKAISEEMSQWGLVLWVSDEACEL